jgi:FtsH-binding integral membrane protein
MVQIDKQVGAGARIGVVADEGLRAYMLRVYNYMAGGVFVTGIIAYLTSSAAITTGPTGAKTLTQFGQLIYVSL